MPTTPKDPKAEGLAALRVPFPPEQIGSLPKGGGVTLSYVGHADVTDRLLNVDPEWSWEPMATDATGLPQFDSMGGLWIRLTVLGVTRIGYGDAGGKSKSPNAVKEAIGDALRNAAMRFGVALDLWAKGDREFGINHDTADAQPQPRTQDQRQAAEKPAQNVQRIHAAMAPLNEANRATVRELAADQWGPEWTPANATDEQTDALVQYATSLAQEQAAASDPVPS